MYFSLTSGCYAGGLCGVGQQIIYLINAVAVPVLFAVAFIVFLYGIAQAYIFSRGDSAKVAQGHWAILWGLIGFAVMISLWGLVNVVVNTFGVGGYPAYPPPTSYSSSAAGYSTGNTAGVQRSQVSVPEPLPNQAVVGPQGIAPGNPGVVTGGT